MRASRLPARVPDRGGWTEGLAHVHALANCLESGVMVIDETNRIAVCSPPMAATFGLNTEEALALTPAQFVERVAALVRDPPRVVVERGLLPAEGRIICEEFEVLGSSRSVVRWVGRCVSVPRPAKIVVCTDITTEVDLAAAYERLAVTDLLTGLANRRGADQLIRREMSRAKRYGSSLSFILIDIDHFKKVNDGYGHNVGDKLLCHVGASVARQLRETDLASRWGGEEFLAVLPNTTIDGARLCAERIRVAVEQLNARPVPSVSVSGGVAQLGAGEDLNQTLARADEKLYEAKAAGRNRIR